MTEPVSNTRFLDFYRAVTRATTGMQNAPSLGDLLNEAARAVRQVSGFDRVMIYRFSETNDGQVIAESRDESLEPFLGLWYPASDIPEQARRMYILSPIRSIRDASYEPIPIVPVINPRSGRPTDLSFANLRSVSPVHCEYLQNMGVAASMSISIVRDGKLWGLVACHHGTPRLLTYETRKACTFLGTVLSGEIVRREVEAEAAFAAQTNITKARFLEFMASTPANPALSLLHGSPNLMDLISCSGAAFIQGEDVHAIGATPGYSHLLDVVQALREAQVPATFGTASLIGRYAAADDIAHVASGVIALQLSQQPARSIVFFRPQLSQVVSWGGDPQKPVTATEDGFRLSPRKSFAAWQEEVHGRSLPWTPSELKAADELRNLISLVSARLN